MHGVLIRRFVPAICMAVLAACGAGGSREYRVTLEVQDGWVREPGTECAGSRPFLYVHRDGPYRVERAGSGDAVAEGSLPAGTAVEAYNEDLGVPRVPTFCRFRLAVGLPEPGDYRLVLEEGDPIPFSVGGSSGPVFLTVP